MKRFFLVVAIVALVSPAKEKAKPPKSDEEKLKQMVLQGPPKEVGEKTNKPVKVNATCQMPVTGVLVNSSDKDYETCLRMKYQRQPQDPAVPLNNPAIAPGVQVQFGK